MKPERQRIAIAEACGWDEKSANRGFKTALRYIDDVPCNQITEKIPDYPNDLNAMHEAEKTLKEQGEWQSYLTSLWNISNPGRELSPCHPANFLSWAMVDATATQRAEAFLKTLGLWEGGDS